MNLAGRLAALERRCTGLVVGVMEMRCGVESPVTVNGQQISWAEFAARYAERPHLLRIYEIKPPEEENRVLRPTKGPSGD